MYTQFFNLREMPFVITPDPAYLYLSPRHQEALGHLLYGTGQYGGFVQLTGEVGTGKTTVVRTLLEQKLTDVDVAMIHNPTQNEIEFLQSICDELGVAYTASATLKNLVDSLNTQLLKVHAAGRRTVLIIDEAQNLPRDVLEQVRLLTNLETHKEKLLRIMLIGQPELIELLARPDLRQLASRITARYHLMPLTEVETGEYIRHRLRVAGTQEELFQPAAIREIHRAAHGVPRLINILCDRALLGAYGQNARRITPAIVNKAAGESLGRSAAVASTELSKLLQRIGVQGWWRRKSSPPLLETALTIAALLVAIALVYRTFFPGGDSAPKAATKTAMVDAPAIASTPAEAAATSETAEAPKTEPAPVADLTTLLQSTQPLAAVMSGLIRLWDSQLVLTRSEGVCSELSGHGLECYKSTGEWADLRTLNRPAILSLTTGRGEVQHLLLRGLSATQATLETARGPLVVPLEQLDALWSGEFLLLWKRETEETYLTPGARGKSVIWVRKHLAEVTGKPLSTPVSERFDAELSQELKRFQTQRGLDSDGKVGVRTLIALSEQVANTPTLVSAPTP